MKFSHKLKRIKQKLSIKLSALSNSAYSGAKPSSQETAAYLICKKLIETEGTILLMAPLSGKRYIKQSDGNLFIIIEENQVQIINHVYSYIVPMYGRTYYKTAQTFDNRIEQNRLEMEAEVKCNIQNTLHRIKKEIVELSNKG